MATQIDALQSFVFLSTNIPQWLTTIEDLVSMCDLLYERSTRLNQHSEVNLTRKRKNGSTESLRPGNNNETAALSAMNVDEPSPPDRTVEAVHSQKQLQSQDLHRKRRAGSDPSGTPSSHCHYRTKNIFIVFYDSQVQGLFEALVKAIATARNNLRKGKNAATIKTRIASMGIAPSTTHDRMEGLLLDPKIMTPALARAKLGRQPRGHETKGFEDADRDLEEAQNLLERGAHQVLRSGNCEAEIEGTRKRFADCKRIASQEIEKLKKEEDAQRAPEMDVEDEKTLVGLTPPSDSMEERPIPIEVSVDKLGPAPPLKQVNFAGAGTTIEVDDGSDDESIQIDISAIRRTVRTTRV